ncbi:kynurenine formamidase-like [Tubulanus polymorphus]|uniref:kynurenine formamidase-like n=1 Tax=Tubulanus polymorphus TaxID=672921 RepID=UPI003DA41C4F
MSWTPRSDEELDHQYDCSRWTKRVDAETMRTDPDRIVTIHLDALKKNEITDASIPCEVLSYDESDRQKVAVYVPKNLPKDAPVLIFIHGGYWQAHFVTHDLFQIVAKAFAPFGAAVALLGYNLCPDVTMSTLVEQVLTGIDKAVEFAAQRGSRGVYVAGVSAGGHLAAMVLAKSSHKLIKGGVPISGLHDVRRLVPTTINKPLYLNDDTAWEVSPLNQLDSYKKNCVDRKILITYGMNESPEFADQSSNLNQALKNLGIDSVLLPVPDVDHFNIIENLIDPEFLLTKEIVKLMGL